MLTVWLYLIGAATACAYAIGAGLGWMPSTPALAVAFLGIASLFLVSAQFCARPNGLQSASHAPPPAPRETPVGHDDHTLVDGIHDIVFQADRDATLTFLNRAWKTITALDARDCVGTSFFQYVHPDDQAQNRERFLQILQPGNDAVRFETRLICRDGRQCWVEVRLTRRLGRHGQINGATGVMTDIHSRKRAEDALRARDRSLSTLLDHLPGMAFRCRNDRSWTMEFVSDGCFELTGYEAVDLLDQSSYDQLIHPDDRDYVWDYVQAQLAQQKAFHLRYRIRTREGQEKWVEERSGGIFAGNGTLLAIEGFVSDVSGQKRDEERIARESLRDTLTGLKSAAMLLDRVAVAIRDDAVTPRPFALLRLDIDNLKRINERHGRPAGDALLAQLGERLGQLSRPGVSVGRHGSDDFDILIYYDTALPDGQLPQLPDLARFTGEAVGDVCTAAVICTSAWLDVIAALLEAPFEIEGVAISISVRVGVALSIDAHSDAQSMFRDARRAGCSTQCQRAGSAVRFAFASKRAQQSSSRWRQSASEFERAFSADALAVSLVSNAVTGARHGVIEGYAHWHSPRMGTMSPAQMFLHAYQRGTLEELVAKYIEVVCTHGLHALRHGQRLAIRLDALPATASLLATAAGALKSLPSRAAGRIDLLLALPAVNRLAPQLPDLQSLREAGVRVGFDITASLLHEDAALSGWLLFADFWRIDVDSEGVRAGGTGNRLSQFFDLAARRGIAIVTAGDSAVTAVKG